MMKCALAESGGWGLKPRCRCDASSRQLKQTVSVRFEVNKRINKIRFYLGKCAGEIIFWHLEKVIPIETGSRVYRKMNH